MSNPSPSNPVRVVTNMLRIALPADKFQPDAAILALDMVVEVFDDFHARCMADTAIPMDEKGRIGMTIAALRKGVQSAQMTISKKAREATPAKRGLHLSHLT